MGKKGKKLKAKKQAYTCEKKIAEYDANLIAKHIDDEELFKQPPPQPECPICAIPLPVSWYHIFGFCRADIIHVVYEYMCLITQLCFKARIPSSSYETLAILHLCLYSYHQCSISIWHAVEC